MGTYKILAGVYDNRVTSELFQRNLSDQTRGNQLKLIKPRCNRDVRKYSFTNRVVDIWNSLPNSVIGAKSVNQFKNRLDKFWEEHPMKFNFKAEYRPTGSRNTIVQVEEELPTVDCEDQRAEST